VDNKYVYICDKYNHRIQLVTKTEGIFFSQWGKGGQSIEFGQFSYPNCIYNDVVDEIFYIGDYHSVQLFLNNVCVQRLGSQEKEDAQFELVYGICIMNDQLYVSDNNRIQIFKATK